LKDFEETRSTDQRDGRKELLYGENRVFELLRGRAEAGPCQQQDQLKESSSIVSHDEYACVVLREHALLYWGSTPGGARLAVLGKHAWVEKYFPKRDTTA